MNRFFCNSLPKIICLSLIAILGYIPGFTQAGISWTARTSAADNNWFSVTYGNNLFVAVAGSGAGNRVMTSPDGITWTARSSAADNTWLSVTYGNGLFVAVGSTGINRVMTSPDGITWTNRASADDANQWTSVVYGNSLFVAVAQSGIGNRVMTSPDGINWTIHSSAADNSWTSVTYGNGLYVAVSTSGVGNRVMTSPNGITWTLRTSAADNTWLGVNYGNNLFVAVSNTASTQVMTSPDGITWTGRTSAATNGWRHVVYGNGLFVAVSSSGIGNRVMTSPDGINWTSRTSAADNFWRSIVYAKGIFVAVGQTGTGNRVMTSGNFTLPVQWISFSARNTGGKNELHWETAQESNNLRFEIERSAQGHSFEKIGEVAAAINPVGSVTYTFTDNALPPGTVYYRLKQVDADGKYEYSKVVAVDNNKELSFFFYPNPVYNQVVITALSEPNKPHKYTITNLAGQTVLTGLIPPNRTINIENLPAGWYQLTVNGMSKAMMKR